MSADPSTGRLTARFVLPDGTERTVEAVTGESVMQTALRTAVPGIFGECGGQLNCSTCHVFVDPGSLDLFGEIDELEDEMLDCTAVERMETSRLSCQLRLGDVTGGVVVTIPDTQY